jgi:hypothetical protein
VEFWLVDVLPSSPKVHSHEVGVFVEVSVNETANGVTPDVGVYVNDATGDAVTGDVI